MNGRRATAAGVTLVELMVAMVLGLLLGPAFTILTPDFSLLATGLTGGSLAYLHHRWAKRRAAP